MIFSLAVCFALSFIGNSSLRAQISQTRVIASVRSVKTPEGMLVTIFENPLLSHVTRQNGNLFQIIIPRAGASVSEGYISSNETVIVRADRRESDAVFSFNLAPGSTVSVKRYAGKLEVLVIAAAGIGADAQKIAPQLKNEEKNTEDTLPLSDAAQR